MIAAAQAHKETTMPKAKKATKHSRKLAAGKKSESVKPLKTNMSDLHVTKPVDAPSANLFK
jgi:hypothetical protein